MRSILIGAALLACSACQAGNSRDGSGTDEVAAIKRAETAQIQAIQARDAAGSAANYADDAVFVGEDGKAIEGLDNIKAAFASMISDPAMSFDYQQGKLVVSEGGDMAYSTANYTYTYTDPATNTPVTSKGANLSVWRKQADGAWKLVADNNAGSTVPPETP